MSDTLSKEHVIFSQKELSEFGGQFGGRYMYMQQRKMLKVVLQISIQMHSLLGGYKSERLIAFIESDTYIITPPPKQFLSLRKIVLKPALSS